MTPSNSSVDSVTSETYTFPHHANDTLPDVSPTRPSAPTAYYIWSDVFALLTSFAFASANVTRFAELAILGACAMLWLGRLAHYGFRVPFGRECAQVVGTLSVAMLADGFIQFLLHADVTRLGLVSGWVMAAVLMPALRSAVRIIAGQRLRVRCVLIGGGETAEHIRAALLKQQGTGYEIVAQVKNLPAAFLQAGASWKKLCAVYNAQHVIIALDGAELATAERPLAQLARESVEFSVSPPLRHLPVHGMVPHTFFGHDTMLLVRDESAQAFQALCKRVLDVVLASAALLALSPIMLVIAILVKRDGGPAFFGHMRLGKDGELFPCLKFRSMVLNGDAVLKQYLANNPEAQAEWNATRKLKDDPRVTLVGRFIRKASIDELPQLLNVLRGQMSIVGPRPIVSAEVPHYEADIAHYYSVRPGITGLWQVSGRNDVSYEQRVKLDSWYVRNFSLLNDIAIILKTIPAILQKRGAY